ncbi:hypothetical protein ACWCOP_00605 [Maricaulaceae bacterium MS644]
MEFDGVRELSMDEIEEVSGAWIANAVGGVIGGLGGAAGAWSAGGGTTAIIAGGLGGAAAGVINPVSGVANGGRLLGGAFLSTHVAEDALQVMGVS